MSSRLLAGLLAVSFNAFAAPPAVDAFLNRKETKPLVDPHALSSISREAWNRGLVSST